MAHVTGALPRYIPGPPINSFHIDQLDSRFYALGYINGITLAGLAWFAPAQRRANRPVAVSPLPSASTAGETAGEDGLESAANGRSDE
jgi:hypothetical protein